MHLNRAFSMGSVAAVCCIAAIAAAPSAQASPRFTVANQGDTKLNVYIFKGDDPFCTLEEKVKAASAGETDSYGCTGNGKGQCKVQLYADGDEICKSNRNTCNKNAIKVSGGRTVTISQDGDKFTCSVS
ncbi:MAG: hypothetical protein AAFW60_07490 [Pseudomonadota bacterium]